MAGKKADRKEDRLIDREIRMVEREMAFQKAFEQIHDPLPRKKRKSHKKKKGMKARLTQWLPYSDKPLQKNPVLFILLVLIVFLVFWLT